MAFFRRLSPHAAWVPAVLVLIVASMAACEEEYTECHEDRAPVDFPPDTDRIAQCDAVCNHLESIGCRLGCPYIPDAGPDADPTSVETSELECREACRISTMEHPEISPDDISRALRCYAGTELCHQVGACSRLCSSEGGRVWPTHLQCSPQNL